MTAWYGLYMAEAENLFPHPIDSCIADFLALKCMGLDPNNYIDAVLTRHNLRESQLSPAEIEKINDAVSD